MEEPEGRVAAYSMGGEVSDQEINEEGLTRREALKKGAILGGVALAWTTPAVQIVGMSPALAATTSPGVAGCSPGFWKDSPGSWEDYWLHSVDGVFDLPLCASEFKGDTLMDALGYTGDAGMTAILLRAAAAAFLNVMVLGNYGFQGDVVGAVNAGLAGCDDGVMEKLKDQLDALNNAGCPLSNDNSFNKPSSNRPNSDKPNSDKPSGPRSSSDK
jgi:hypothetical protein